MELSPRGLEVLLEALHHAAHPDAEGAKVSSYLVLRS